MDFSRSQPTWDSVPSTTMPLNNSNENRPSSRFRRRSASQLALFCAERARLNWQLALAGVRSKEISNCSFDYDLSMMTDRRYLELFRFIRRSLEEIIRLFARPETKRRTAYIGYTNTSKLAGCLILARLSAPARWCDLERLFGRFAPQLSELFKKASKHFIDAQGNLIKSEIPTRFFNTNVERNSQRVYIKCLTLENIVGFIGGTVLDIARPEGRDSNQRVVYNGHKRKLRPSNRQ